MARPAKQIQEFEQIYAGADRAGRLAAERQDVIPMTVQQHANPMDDTSPVTKRWFVPSGVCGFAWVVIKPATSAFAKWLKETDKARPGYGGGLHIWIRQYGQCMQQKEAYAAAFAEFLGHRGIKAYMDSRMD